MPVSKRDKKVSLTKTKKKGLQSKENIVEKIKEKIDEFENVFVFTVNNMRNAPLKDVRDQWKDSRFFFAKKTLMIRAIKNQSQVMKNMTKLGKCLVGQCGLLFTNKSKKYVLSWFEEYSTMDYAKSGFIATETVTIPAGPLPDLQSTMEPVLRKLGLPTQLEKGKIVLRENHVVCTEGARLTPEQATILKHLAKPMSEFKITILCMWSKDGTFEKYKKVNTPSKLKKPIEPKPTNKRKSKKSNKKQPKLSTNGNINDNYKKVRLTDDDSVDGDGGYELKYEEDNMKGNVSEDDGEEGIVEDHSEDGGEEKSDQNESEDERMDEDGEIDEDEGMHEDEGHDSDDGICPPNYSEDIGEEVQIETHKKVNSPKGKMQNKTPKGNKTSNQSVSPLETSSKKKSHEGQTPNQINTPKHAMVSPQKQNSFDSKTPKTTTPKLIDNQPRESDESSQEASNDENVSKKSKTPETMSPLKIKTPNLNDNLPGDNNSTEDTKESTQETKSSSPNKELKSPNTIRTPKIKTPKLKDNLRKDNSIVESTSSLEPITSSQESTALSQETETSSQEESEETTEIEDTMLNNSQKQGKTPNTRNRKESTSKQSKKSPQKMKPDEEIKTEGVGVSNPSPKITRSNPRRSLRTPKPVKRSPVKRTPPNETKPSDLVTGSAKRLRSTPLKGTPQKSKDTPNRTARRKSIFPKTVTEDVEMK